MASENKKTRKDTRENLSKSLTQIPLIPTTEKKTDVKSPEQQILFDKNAAKKSSTGHSTLYELSESTAFDASAPLYMQINANNIFRYFASALISPRYSDSSNFADIQSINPNVITLANGFIGNVQERTVLIELELNASETGQLTIDNGVAFFEKPLPISRVKRILVSHKEITAEIISTAAVGDGGIIPEKLFSVFLPKHLLFPAPGVNVNEKNTPDQNLLFDKILGALAYLKNYSILLAHKNSTVKTLTDHFLTAVKMLNQNYSWKVENERVGNFYRILFGMNSVDQPPLQWLVKRMLKAENFTDNDVFAFADLMATSQEDFFNEARDLFNSLIKSLERKTAIREIPQLKNNEKFYLYLFAVLRQYGNINTEDKSISRADLPELVFSGYGEYTFACLGFFYGYTELRNYEERLKLKDPIFDQVFVREKRLPLKFTLDTALELSLIESVYQYVFNEQTDISISDYRGYPQMNVELIRRPQNIEGRYTFDGSVSYGRAIVRLTRKNSYDRLEQLLQHIHTIPAISVIGARCYRSKLPVQSLPLTEIGKVEWKSLLFFKKEDLLQAVKNGVLVSDEVIEDVMFGLTVKEL